MVRFDYSQITKNLGVYKTRVEAGLLMYATTKANELESYMKLNRPWTDRTGHARQRLTGWVEVLTNKVRIYIGHGVDYGIYLELCHEKRYAILQPTVNALSKEVLKGYKELTRYMKP